MIDNLWRNFLRGEIVSLEKKLIQEGLDNFFSFPLKTSYQMLILTITTLSGLQFQQPICKE